MRPRAVKANRTLTPLETAEPLLEELLEELLGVGVGVEVEPELGGVEVGVEDSVMPCAELDKVQRTADRMLTYHSATHLDSSSNGLLEVITSTIFLKAESGVVDKGLVTAQTFGIVESA